MKILVEYFTIEDSSLALYMSVHNKGQLLILKPTII